MTSRQQCEFCERTLWMDRLGTCDECHAAGVNGDTPKALINQDEGGLQDSYQAGYAAGRQAHVSTRGDYDAPTIPEGVDEIEYASGYGVGYETQIDIARDQREREFFEGQQAESEEA